MRGQLTLDLSAAPSYRPHDFHIGPANAVAVQALRAPQTWPGQKAVLTGPAGSGKSHLAAIWASDRGADLLPAAWLARAEIPKFGDRPLVVEDADRIAGDPLAETALFHLHNLLAERVQLLLVTARHPPRDWGLGLPDLASRLQAAAHFGIGDPDDALLRAVITKQFADRQLRVDPDLIDWLALRMTRSWESAQSLVTALDARALQEGAPVSRTLAQGWLDGDGLFPEFQ